MCAPGSGPFISGRLGRRRGSRPGTRKANEIGFQARTSGPRKAESRPVRRRGSRPASGLKEAPQRTV